MKEIQLCTAIKERAERSKSEAVANVSHELCTPIIGMMGMIEELLDSSLQERQHADLVDARACAGETIDLINRVLDLAKLQAGKLQLETLPCYLRRIVREAAEVGAPTVTGKESASDFHVDESVPETLIGDPSRLLQVMAELVGECSQLFPAASAVNNTATGNIATSLWCIPPQHSATRPPPLETQASSEPPPASSAWLKLDSCVRRFPPPPCLLCLPVCRPVSKRGPVGNGVRRECGGACGRDDVCSVVERRGGDGRLEEEVREWVEGACKAREEGEWMVVVACEDMGGGIPPEEMRWVLDPHGLAGHSPHDMHGNGQHKAMVSTAETAWGVRDTSGGIPPKELRRWYPTRGAAVAEMRGDMAVLSDASTCTTILLALPMGGGESGSWEGSGKEPGDSGGAGKERVGREARSHGGTEGPASGAAASVLPHAATAAAQPASRERQAAGCQAVSGSRLASPASLLYHSALAAHPPATS
ncbi:unnamed protein product [Closterium sp. NIES-54]